VIKYGKHAKERTILQYQAILFDFDYTLGDATESIYEGYCYGFTQMGHPQPTLETVRQSVGYTLEDGYSILTGDRSPERRQEFRDWFRQKVEKRQAQTTRLFPGAEDLLTALHSQGVKTGIVTSKHLAALNAILERYNLLPVLDFTIGGEGVSHPKPDPQGLELALAALCVPKSAVLYCGDTVLDAGAAQNAGIPFSAVLNGTTQAEAFTAFPCVHIAPDLLELRRWLGL